MKKFNLVKQFCLIIILLAAFHNDCIGQTIPDKIANAVSIGNPCISGSTTTPTINCDMLEIKTIDGDVGTLKAIVWDEKDQTGWTNPYFFVEDYAGNNVSGAIPFLGKDPDVILLDDLNNPGGDYYMAVVFGGWDAMLEVYKITNIGTSSLSVSLVWGCTIVNNPNSSPHIDAWSDPTTIINGKPAIHEFSIVCTDIASDLLQLWFTDINTFLTTLVLPAPLAPGFLGIDPDIAAYTDVTTGEKSIVTSYVDVAGTDLYYWEYNVTTASSPMGAPLSIQTAPAILYPRVEAMSLYDPALNSAKWQIASIVSTAVGWEIYGYNDLAGGFNVSNTTWDFFSPAVAAGLGSPAPAPGDVCNTNYVINYFKAVDNVYSTDVLVTGGAWSGNMLQVNMSAINHPNPNPRFVAVSSCSNSGLNILSAWYDGSGSCATPGNGQIMYKESPNAMAFKINNVKNFSKEQPILYPNPATDKVHITGLNEKQLSYSVQDVFGKTVMQGVNTGNTINIEQLPAGLYILKTHEDKTIHTLKFTKK